MKHKIVVSEEEFWTIEELKTKFRVLSLMAVFQKLGVKEGWIPKLTNIETDIYEYLKKRQATVNELMVWCGCTSGRISQIMNGRGKNPGLLFKQNDIAVKREKGSHKTTYSLK